MTIIIVKSGGGGGGVTLPIAISDVTNLQTSLDAKLGGGTEAVTNGAYMYYGVSGVSVSGSFANLVSGYFMFKTATITALSITNLDKLENATEMFHTANMSALTSLAIPNTPVLKLASSMFNTANMSGLTTFTLGGLAAVTNASNMFAGANLSSLTSFTIPNMAAVTNASSMFASANLSGLTSLTIPAMTLNTSANNMFYQTNLSALTSLTIGEMPLVTSVSSMFFNLNAPLLTSITIPANFGNGLTFNQFLNNGSTFAGTVTINCKVNQLQVQGASGNNTKITGLRLTNADSAFSGSSPQINVSYTNLDATALNTLFTDLPTVVGKTITITGAVGAATCDTTIATAKGWTVTS